MGRRPTFLQAARALVAGAAVLLAAASPAPASAPPEFARDGDGLATNGQTVAQPAGPRKQILAIIPDRTTGRDWGLRYLAEAVDDFNRIQPDAVFCVGDLVQGAGVKPVGENNLRRGVAVGRQVQGLMITSHQPGVLADGEGCIKNPFKVIDAV